MATVSSKLVPATMPTKKIPDERRGATSNTEAVGVPVVQTRDRRPVQFSLTDEWSRQGFAATVTHPAVQISSWLQSLNDTR